MRYIRRKSAPKVRDGITQFKNNWSYTRHWSQTDLRRYVIDPERPGSGYRHVLRQRDLERFVGLLPEWEELSKGVDVLLLAKGDPSCYGWYNLGNVAVCAWDRELGQEWPESSVDDERDVLERLGVPLEPAKEPGFVRLGFTEASVRGFQLMSVLLHELGHHHDRMTSKNQERCGRGESYADRYAERHAEGLWEAYYREFGW